jgi:hypothetical protein
MRSAVVFSATAALAASAFAAVAVPALTAGAAVPAATPAVAQRYGIIRYDPAAHHWAILTTSPFHASGLTGVTCSSSTGKITVGFTPLATIGTFTVDPDDAYAGRYAAGAAVTATSMVIVLRKASTGAAVSCAASELQVANSSLQLSITGTTATTPAPTPSTKPPTTKPTTTPPTTAPTTHPPTTEPPTTLPPTQPPTLDPTDPTSPPAGGGG